MMTPLSPNVKSTLLCHQQPHKGQQEKLDKVRAAWRESSKISSPALSFPDSSHLGFGVGYKTCHASCSSPHAPKLHLLHFSPNKSKLLTPLQPLETAAWQIWQRITQ